MNPAPLTCPGCKATLEGGGLNLPGLHPCSNCGVPLQVEVFPALFRRGAAGRDGEPAMEEGESTCFFHPAKKAVRPCEGCGRFVCALCDCELHGQHFCPTCLETGKKKGKIKSLENRRTLYDSIALTLSLLPLLAWPITIVTAPAALYMSLRYWNAPRGIIRRTKVRYILAIIFSTLQIAGWVVGIYFIATASRNRG